MVASATVSLTVNVATPDAFVTPETVVIVDEPPDFASVTVLPETGFDCASFRVTVIVELVLLSATTEAGDAETVDCAAVTGPAVNVTAAVWVIVTESEVSVAV